MLGTALETRPALANSNRDLIRVVTQDPTINPGTLIVPDPIQGKIDGAILLPGKPESLSEGGIVDLTRGSRMGAVLGSEARIGLSTKNGVFEIGINGGIGVGEGFLFGLPLAVGGYLQISPIPGEIGKRIYLRGSVYWTYAVGVTEVALGYRHLIDDLSASRDYWFIELGSISASPAAITQCPTCDLAGKFMLTFGFAFR